MATLFTASDVMDQSAILLNDPAKALFSYDAQLPYLKRANEFLENLMVSNGVSIQRQVSVIVTVSPSTTNIDLSGVIGYPADMLLPIRCLESQVATGQFVQMFEKDWEPEINVTSSINMWVYRNNRIYVPGVTQIRYIKIDYWRQLIELFSSANSIEVIASKTYLAAKTAEMCARYIGQNSDVANDLLGIEVVPAQELLEGIYIKNSQGVRTRRMRFTRPRTYYSR